MKKLFALLLATALGLSACTVAKKAETDIVLATYAIGDWGTQEGIDAILEAFHGAHPEIRVTVQLLTYADGDKTIDGALTAGTAPDIVMEGPERLVANWGAKGKLVDLSDLWTDAVRADTYEAVIDACFDGEGRAYEYPLCMSAHCMAVNKDLFEAAGALEYLDLETHTWTTENFFRAIQALYDRGQKNVAEIYCKDQGGDQGTRALVTNLYGGRFTDPDHTRYTVDTPENLRALEALTDTPGIRFNTAHAGGDEAAAFARGNLAMSFCWNAVTHKAQEETINGAFEVIPMAFPAPAGTDPQLSGGIWGFGIFQNGDERRIEAAKTFLRWACDENTEASVRATGFFPTRKSIQVSYPELPGAEVYASFLNYLGDYDSVTPGWTEARAEWWKLLQRISVEGADVAAEAAEFTARANKAAGAS